jgi:hypothetical protein
MGFAHIPIFILLPWVCATLSLATAMGTTSATPPHSPVQSVAADDLCVTNGAIKPLANGHLVVETASSRAVLRYQTIPVAEIRFRYLGPSAGSKPLASGELRRQIGIKLRAQDTCNLLYAMWHIEPDSKIAVSVKRNPRMATHEQCGANGYVNITPLVDVVRPQIGPGPSHRLRAELHDTDLTLFADDAMVWQGNLGTQRIDFNGPVGLRTDNARFEFEFFAGARAQIKDTSERTGPCVQNPGD